MTKQQALIQRAQRDKLFGTIRIGGYYRSSRSSVRKQAHSASPLPIAPEQSKRGPCALLSLARLTAFRRSCSVLGAELVDPFGGHGVGLSWLKVPCAERSIVPAIPNVNCQIYPKTQKTGEKSGELLNGEHPEFDLTPIPVSSGAPNESHLVNFVSELFSWDAAPIKAELKRLAEGRVGPKELTKTEDGAERKILCSEVRKEGLKQAGTLWNLQELFNEVPALDRLPKEVTPGAIRALQQALYWKTGEEGVKLLARMIENPSKPVFVPLEDGKQFQCIGADALALVARSVRKTVTTVFAEGRERSVRLNKLGLPPETFPAVFAFVIEGIRDGSSAERANGKAQTIGLYLKPNARQGRNRGNWGEYLYAKVDIDPCPWRALAVLKWEAKAGFRELARIQGGGVQDKGIDLETRDEETGEQVWFTDSEGAEELRLKVAESIIYLSERSGEELTYCHALVNARLEGYSREDTAERLGELTGKTEHLDHVRALIALAEEYWTPELTEEERGKETLIAWKEQIRRHHKKAKLDSRPPTRRAELVGFRRALGTGKAKQAKKAELVAWKELLVS